MMGRCSQRPLPGPPIRILRIVCSTFFTKLKPQRTESNVAESVSIARAVDSRICRNRSTALDRAKWACRSMRIDAKTVAGQSSCFKHHHWAFRRKSAVRHNVSSNASEAHSTHQHVCGGFGMGGESVDVDVVESLGSVSEKISSMRCPSSSQSFNARYKLGAYSPRSR